MTPTFPAPDGTKVRVGRPTIVITNPDGTLKSVTVCPPQTPAERARARRWLGWMLGLMVLGFLALGHGQLAVGGVSIAMASVVPIAWKRAMLLNRAWKAALFVGAANLGNATPGYSTTNEVVGTGYAAGGAVLASDPLNGGFVITGSDGVTALLDFLDTSWPGATFTARYVLVYDNSLAGKEGFVIDMGSDQTVTGGAFNIQWPVADLLTAILQVA